MHRYPKPSVRRNGPSASSSAQLQSWASRTNKTIPATVHTVQNTNDNGGSSGDLSVSNTTSTNPSPKKVIGYRTATSKQTERMKPLIPRHTQTRHQRARGSNPKSSSSIVNAHKK